MVKGKGLREKDKKLKVKQRPACKNAGLCLLKGALLYAKNSAL